VEIKVRTRFADDRRSLGI